MFTLTLCRRGGGEGGGRQDTAFMISLMDKTFR